MNMFIGTLTLGCTGTVGKLHTCLLLSNFQQIHLLEVTKQQTCMKRSYCAMY